MKACADRRDITLYQVIKTSAELYPDRIAYEFMGKAKSFKEFLVNIDDTANAYLTRGIKAGAHVALCLPNSPQLITSIYALSSIGAVAVLINPLLPGNEIIKYMDKTDCETILVLDLLISHYAKDFIRDLTNKTVISVSIKGNMAFRHQLKMFTLGLPQISESLYWQRKLGTISWDDFMKSRRNIPFEENNDPHKDAVILFSSGTMHDAKAAVHSSFTINTAAFYCLETEPPVADGDSMLAVLPAFHIFGFTVCIHITLACAAKCYLIPRFNPELVAKLIVDKKPLYMAGVPALFEGILRSRYLKRANGRKKIDMSRFRVAFCGGDSLPETTRVRFDQFIRQNGGKGFLAEGYGLTECCPISAMTVGYSSVRGMGRPFSGISLAIVEPETDIEVQTGQTGEICILSDAVMKGYYHDDIATSKVLKKHRDGQIWLHTGDMGWKDEMGYIYYSHRTERMVKIKGYKVFLDALEKTVSECHLVNKAAAIALSDNYNLNRIRIFVILKAGYSKKTARQQIMSFCRQKMPPWAIPADIELCEALPVNVLGKTSFGRLKITEMKANEG